MDFHIQFTVRRPGECPHGAPRPRRPCRRPPPSDDRRIQLERALKGENVVFDRETLEGPNESRWVRAHYMPIFQGERVIGVLIIQVDIQNLKETQATLAEAERQISLITDSVGFPITCIDRAGPEKETMLQRIRLLELITDNVGLPLSYIDRDFRYRYTNQPDHDWPEGATRDAVIGRAIEEVYAPGTLAIVRPHLERALAGEKAVYERMAKDAQGRSRDAAGCAAGQGYLLCPPLPATEFSRWLKARTKKK